MPEVTQFMLSQSRRAYRFLKHRVLPSRFTQLITRTFLKWQQDECLEMGAALAYYALFSLFPIFLVILSVFGFLLGPDTDVHNQILQYAETALPPSAFRAVNSTIRQLNQGSLGASLVGFGLLFFTASGVFAALDRSVDKIWKVHRTRNANQNWKTVVWTFVKDRFIAFGMVLGSAGILLISLLLNIGIKVILGLLKNVDATIAWVQLDDVLLLRSLQVGATFLLLTLTIMILFRLLPATSIKWGDVWLGALITVGLLMFLQRLVSNSVIQIGSQFRSYGIVGGVMVLLLWIYITCQIFFLGSEFTYVYAHLFGSRRERLNLFNNRSSSS